MDEEVASKKAFSGKKIAEAPVFGLTSYKDYLGPGLLPYASSLSGYPLTPGVTPTATGPGLSTALDARLECGLETKAEIQLRKLLSLQTDTLQGAFATPLPMPPANGRSTLRAQAAQTDDELAESISTQARVSVIDKIIHMNVFEDFHLSMWPRPLLCCFPKRIIS